MVNNFVKGAMDLVSNVVKFFDRILMPHRNPEELRKKRCSNSPTDNVFLREFKYPRLDAESDQRRYSLDGNGPLSTSNHQNFSNILNNVSCSSNNAHGMFMDLSRYNNGGGAVRRSATNNNRSRNMAYDNEDIKVIEINDDENGGAVRRRGTNEIGARRVANEYEDMKAIELSDNENDDVTVCRVANFSLKSQANKRYAPFSRGGVHLTTHGARYTKPLSSPFKHVSARRLTPSKIPMAPRSVTRATRVHQTVSDSFMMDEKNKYFKLLKDTVNLSKISVPRHVNELIPMKDFSKSSKSSPVIVLDDDDDDEPQSNRSRKFNATSTSRASKSLFLNDYRSNASNLSMLDSIFIEDDDDDDADNELTSSKTSTSTRNVSPLVKFNSIEPLISSKKVCSREWLDQMTQTYSDSDTNKQQDIKHAESIRNAMGQGVNHQMGVREADNFMSRLTLNDPPLEATETPDTVLPPFTDAQLRRIHDALRPGPPSQVLVTAFSISITRKDIATLNKTNWLNDEVINFYMNLIMDRSEKNPEKYPKVYVMNTFFFSKLHQGFDGLKRWTRKVDIFSYDLILIPIHLQVHWCMCIIDFRAKEVRYYDSMGQHNPRCTGMMLQYLVSEMQDKKQQLFDTSDWKTPELSSTIPQQQNGSDCGVFACTFAEYAARDARFSFSQENMRYLRQKMVLEIVQAKLLLE